MTRRNHSLSGASVALALLALAGCNSDSSPTSPLAPSTEPSTAQVRAVHLSPDAPLVDVWVDGAVAFRALPYPVDSQYASLPAGPHRIQVTPTGTAQPVVIDATLTLTSGQAYSVVATGLLGQGDLQPLVLEDDRTPAAGQARVRFVHTSPDAPPVDVAVTGGPVLFGNVAFRQASSYATVAPGTYNLEVRVAGTQTVALAVPGVSLGAGSNWTIFAIGRLADGSLAARPVRN